jgi:hypothetical protein
MAGTTRKHRASWVALGLVGLLLVIGLTVLLVVTLQRPASSSSASAPVPTPTSAQEPAPNGATSAVDAAQQHQQYRAYVSTVVDGGTAVAAGLIGLEGCRNGRAQCLQRLDEASSQVRGLQRDLAANPTPACLTTADQRLQDALTWQQKGLGNARDGVRTKNRVQLAQGLFLTAAGLWRAGQAVVDGRQANC